MPMRRTSVIASVASRSAFTFNHILLNTHVICYTTSHNSKIGFKARIYRPPGHMPAVAQRRCGCCGARGGDMRDEVL